MMLSPYEVRLHLRIDDDAVDDFSMYVEAAEDHVQQHMGRAVFATESEAQAAPAETDPIVMNASIKAAILLLAGHLYANREAVTQPQAFEVPWGVKTLLLPYRVNMGV